LDLGLVVRRHELTDEQWQVVEPLLTVSGGRAARGSMTVG
jgi:transposase